MDEALRQFGGIEDIVISRGSLTDEKRKANLQALREGIVGANSLFDTAYDGKRPIVYADWTASARGVHQIEQYIQNEVNPFYGNTHTTTSITGHQSTCFRAESRQIIAQAVNAKVTGKAAEDVVLFSGNGTTSAIEKLVQSMDLNLPVPEGYDAEVYRPVVFTSAYEHHSNLLPWRESCAEVVTIAYSPDTGIDLTDLVAQLQKYKHRAVKIGAMCAASNVTGIMTAVDAVSILLHEAGALAFFDYATAAPYVRMDMNPTKCRDCAGMDKSTLSTSSWNPKYAYKDAIYFSGHKFLGGVGCPGVLVVKRAVLPSAGTLPGTVGGGTVFYVTENHHRYLSNREEREEGGTPNVVGDVKLGLAVNLKQSFGDDWVEAEELRVAEAATARLQAHENIVVLGKQGAAPKLPIFSILIRCGARLLHHNFVCALLNDLFGVQARGGCQCAGPFSQLLLGISATTNVEMESALLEKHEILRPGYARFSLPFWLCDQEYEHILRAVEFVASHGIKFLPFYRYNHKTGEWAHSTRLTKFPERKWLSKFDLGGTRETPAEDNFEPARLVGVLEETRASVERELAAIQQNSAHAKDRCKTGGAADGLGKWEHLRWYTLAADKIEYGQELVGALRPLHVPSANKLSQSPNGTSPLLAQRSAYLDKRDKKISLNVGEGRLMPQYLRVFGGSQKRVAKQEQPQEVTDIHTPAGAPTSEDSEGGSEPTSAFPGCSSGSCLLPVKRAVPEPAPALEVKVVQPPKKLMRSVGQCMQDWGMIQDGDRLLLGLSGGKDSLSLLHVLLALQKRAPVKFTLACCTIDPQTASFDPSPLIPYVKALGVEYHYVSQPIIDMASSKLQGDSLCAFCARFKRGLLYSCCREHKYNKLVLAQHLDDLGESFLMSVLHNGQLRTMKAKYEIEAGDIEVIRPLAYLRETATRDFAKAATLPVINENCPACFEEPKERARVKQVLSQEESMVPNLFSNLRKALLPLMHDDTYKVIERVSNDIEAKNSSKKRKGAVTDASLPSQRAKLA